MEQQHPDEQVPAPEQGSDQASEQQQGHERTPESEGAFPPGLTARVELTVTDLDTAQAERALDGS